MAAPRIILYLDIVSPFGYIAFHVLRDYMAHLATPLFVQRLTSLKNSPVFAQCNVNYVPIFLGGLMNACGNTPPIKIKNKDVWIDQERRRWAKYFSVPMIEKFTEGFPPLTLGTQRALCAITQKQPNKLVPTIEALYHSFWVQGNAQIGKPEGFGPVLESVLGKAEAQEILTAMNQPETKALLGANTDQAFKSGAFGIPWFECTNTKGETEGFWGIDHLGQVVDFLGLDRRLDNGFRAVL